MFEALKIYKKQKIKLEDTYAVLDKLGYKRVGVVQEEGDFSARGENLFIFPATFEYPIRIELSNDEVENIKTIDAVSFTAISDHEMVIILPFGGILHRRKLKKEKIHNEKDPIDAFVDIEPQDYVVHIDYGIGRYLGTERIKAKKGFTDHLVIEYKGGDRVFVPFEDLNKVQKYIALQKCPPKLYKIGSRLWVRAKQATEHSIAKVAYDILEIQAKRNMLKGYKYSKDTDWQELLEKAFPYKETPDQLKATLEAKKDMESVKPMDRLLCGDVGYGKTEVALRAAFKAVMDNKQVAILVPTTILAEQHDTVFRKRMKDFPVDIGMLSRFKTKFEQKNLIKALSDGKIDIIIGTHRLLSKDVRFKKLGLLIIDEEQRFGVKHKESLKKMRLVVDVLTLTATPIP
ncbi:MAG: DEAD/DEAH box helicase, partial [Candidatus Omnitrophota bacterium]